MDKVSLTALAHQQLTLGRTASSGPSSQSVYGGQDHAPRHTGPTDRRPDRRAARSAKRPNTPPGMRLTS